MSKIVLTEDGLVVDKDVSLCNAEREGFTLQDVNNFRNGYSKEISEIDKVIDDLI